MGKFSGVLLYADYDHTLTDTHSVVPAKNLEAIRRFMEEGGLFAVCTGRSITMCGAFLDIVPFNTPLILFNGAMAYDTETKQPIFTHAIDLDPETAIRMTRARFPGFPVEVQGLDAHYTFEDLPLWQAFGRANNAVFRQISLDQIPLPFLKFSMTGPFLDDTVTQFYSGTAEELAFFDEAERWFQEAFGAVCAVDRSAARIIDLQAKGVSKGSAALEMKERLGARKLVCIGDGMNDLSMLRAADLPFVPADAVTYLTERFPTVCPCDGGSVADLIRGLPKYL